MYKFDQIATEKDEMKQAVLHARAYKPIYVKIKVNYGCNLKCEMCKHWRETREPPISMDRFREIISELGELGCKKIHFSGGEPMLRPQLPDLVEHATQLGMRVTLTTNGTLIDKVKAKRLVKSPQEAARALAKKKIDLFISDSPIVWWLAGMNEVEGLVALPLFLSEERLAWAVRKSDADLLESVNAALEKLQKAGRATAIIRRWLPQHK